MACVVVEEDELVLDSLMPPAWMRAQLIGSFLQAARSIAGMPLLISVAVMPHDEPVLLWPMPRRQIPSRGPWA